MPEISLIKSQEIEEALRKHYRQYLTGKLALPQELKEISDSNIEVGISEYINASYENPHTHSIVTEYQYILQGMTEYLDIETKKIYRFTKGDFYVIHPSTKYAQKIKQGTRILFFKNPAINDKLSLGADNETELWMKDTLHVKRVDFSNSRTAPEPNTIKPAVSVAILNSKNELLLLERRDSKNWTIPGGTLEFGENLTSCAIREIKEETGLDIKIIDIVGTYTNPNNIVCYDDGECRQEFTILFFGKMVPGSIQIDDESLRYTWVDLNQASKVKLANSQKIRIEDFQKYIAVGKRSFR